MKLKLKKTVALGNGTRNAGTVLATLTDDPAKCVGNPGKAKFKCEEGVDKSEVIMALRNQHLCEFDNGKRKKEPANKPNKDAWRATPLVSLSLDKSVTNLLAKNKLSTAGDVFDFGEKNNGLSTLGFDEDTELAVLEAISELQPKS